jgi:hypothetical protein
VIEHTVEEALEQYFLTPQSVTYFIILALLGFYLKVQKKIRTEYAMLAHILCINSFYI